MFITAKTAANTTPRLIRGRRLTLLERLVRWNTAYRETQSFASLDEAARRDMGIGGQEKITVAEVLARPQR